VKPIVLVVTDDRYECACSHAVVGDVDVRVIEHFDERLESLAETEAREAALGQRQWLVELHDELLQRGVTPGGYAMQLIDYEIEDIDLFLDETDEVGA
jgi:hypothetical protein